MTSKNLFFNLMREDLKRRLWAAALTFLTFFFTLPVASALVLSEKANIISGDPYPGMLQSIQEILSFENGFLAVFIVVLSLILGVTSFSWLHSRKKVDFYHALPVAREKLFFVNFLDGILILVSAYAVNLLLGIAAAVVNGIMPGDIIPNALKAFGFFTLHFIMLYSVTVLAMVMTGNVLVGILGTGVFHLYFPILIIVLDTMYLEFFKTSYNGGSRLTNILLDKCSALTLYMKNYSQAMSDLSGGNMVMRMVAVMLVTAAVTAVSLLLYRKRGSEAAGKAMAFNVSQPIIRIPIVILSALGGGLFFWYLHSSFGWAVFGIACGIMLSHCIIEIIYHFDFKKLFSNRISMGVCAAASVLIFCGFRYDLLGYDTYIPKKEDLESAAVSLTNMEYWIDYGAAEVDGDGNYSWQYESGDTYIFSRMRLTDTDTAMALTKEAVSQIEREKDGGIDQEAYSEGNVFRFSVKFNLKGGREVFRSYTLYGNTAYQLVKSIYDSPEYRMAAYPVMEQTTENTGKIKVEQNNWTKEVTRGSSKAGEDFVDLILSTYQQEMGDLTSEEMEQENPVARIQFMTIEQVGAEKAKAKSGSSWRFDNVLNRGYYPIYPSFAKTIGLLEECGVVVNTGSLAENVIKADIELYQLVTKQDADYEKEVSGTFTVTDSSELKALIKTARVEDYSDMNPFCRWSDRIRFDVVVKGSSGQTSHRYSIQKEDVPEFLKKAAKSVSD